MQDATKTKWLDRIIWSADVADETSLQSKLGTMPNGLRPKIDRLFADANGGPAVIGRVMDLGWEVFDDAKIVEIPSKLEAVARVHLQYRPWMLNCMAGASSTGFMEHDNAELVDGLKRFADACHEFGTLPCGVTVLTSKTPEMVAREFNGRSAVDQVLEYAAMMMVAGFTDLVCAPEEAEAIRSDSAFDRLDLNCPSIRMPDSPVDDQARSRTPVEAITAGVRRLVIGRPITNGVPADNLQTIIDSLQAAA